MELDEWIQQNMKEFIEEKHPATKKLKAVRQDDAGLIINRDYLSLVDQALKNDRYRRAQELFNELKQKFTQVPLDHQEERKRYYRIMQRCYKKIYDYVADSHKTARIMTQLENSQDVFNQSVKPVNLDNVKVHEAPAIQPVEVVMMRAPMDLKNVQEFSMPPLETAKKKEPDVEIPEMPTKQDMEEPIPELPPEPEPPVLKKKSKKAAEPEVAPPEETTPVKTQPEESASVETLPEEPALVQPDEPRPLQEEPQEIREDTLTIPEQRQNILKDIKGVPAPKPDWTPPTIEEPIRRNITEPQEKTVMLPPRPKVDEREMRKRTAKEFARQAHSAIMDGQYDEAQKNLMEARVEVRRAGGDIDILRRIVALEKTLAHHLTPQERSHVDHEIFSQLYLKGVQAMAQGNYKGAAEYFFQRTQQTPYDRAAQIRLAECLEVLYGKSA